VNEKILCIEDNPDNMILIRRVLQARGYQLLEAETGIDGLTLAQDREIRLILLDINLPDIDGYEIARRLRTDLNHREERIPIIAITANALKGDAERVLEAGCDVYMAKPINIHELWARVAYFLPRTESPAGAA
jgi:two-component system cell cycle response regulator DivK